MKIKNIKRKYLLLLLSFLVLVGCAESKIVDDVSLIRGISFDLVEDNKLKVKIAIPIYEDEKTTETDFYIETTTTSKGAIAKLNAEAPNPLVSGQLAISLYGEALARKGLSDNLDTLMRDPSIGNRVFLAITEGEAGEILSKDLTAVGERPPTYLANLLDQNIMSESLPRTNLHIFLDDYYSDGKDPVLPLLKKSDKHAEIKGIALFNGDKYVDELPLKNAFYLRLLTNEGFRAGTFELELDKQTDKGSEKDKEEIKERDIIVIDNIRSDLDCKVKTGESPKFTLHIGVKGLIKEYTGNLNMDDRQFINHIKKLLKNKIEKKSESIIKQFQDQNIDPLGLGEHYRSNIRQWDPKKWKDVYPQVEVKVVADVKILQSGIVE